MISGSQTATTCAHNPRFKKYFDTSDDFNYASNKYELVPVSPERYLHLNEEQKGCGVEFLCARAALSVRVDLILRTFQIVPSRSPVGPYSQGGQEMRNALFGLTRHCQGYS